MLIVNTKEELQAAKENKVKEFIVVGELAQQLNKARKISSLSKKALLGLGVAIGAGALAAPVTGGASLGASAFIGAATTGVSAGVMYAAIAAGGVLVVIALFKDYNVKLKRNPDGSIELEFNKK